MTGRGYTVAALAVGLAVTVGSLWPGTLASWPEALTKLRAAPTLAIHQPVFVTLFERFVSFFPLGWLIYRAASGTVRRSAFAACAALSMFALLLELAQAFVQGRHTRLSDCLLAMAFGGLGVSVGLWRAHHPSPASLRALVLVALVLGNVAIASVISYAHLGKAIEGWNCSYPLIVANEASADRPWRGSIRGLALYPRALAAEDAARLVTVPFSQEGVHERESTGALLTYDFGAVDTQRVPDALPKGPADALMLQATGLTNWRPDQGALEVLGPSLIRGDRPPRELCEAILASGAFAVEVEVASADAMQGGPARIVTQSVNPFLRNFTLGQDRRALVFRVRTPWNGPDGSRVELHAENALPDQDWHHIVASYGRGVATVFVDGQPSASIRYHELMWLSDMRIVPIAAFAAIGFAALGVAVGWSTAGASWGRRIGYAYLGAALVPTTVGVVLGLHLGHEPDWWLIAAAVVGPPVGLLGQATASRLIASWRGWPPANAAPVAHAGLRPGRPRSARRQARR